MKYCFAVRYLVRLFAVMLCCASPFAAASKVTIELGYAANETSAYAVLANRFERLAESYSKRSIDVRVRCCSRLSTEDQAFRAMQLGKVDMFIITANNISPHYPSMDAFVLPYIFQNREHTYRVLNGPIGEAVAGQILERTRVHLLTYGFVGYRDFYNSMIPIERIEDLRRMKVRVPRNQVMIATYKAFGAVPIPLVWADTAEAIKSGQVHGGDNGASFIKSQGFYRSMKYLSVLEHFAYFSPLLAGPHVMARLDDEQKAAVLKAATEAGEHHREFMEKETESIRQYLTSAGGMLRTDPDKTAFIRAAQKVQDEFAADRGRDFQQLVMAIRAAASE